MTYIYLFIIGFLCIKLYKVNMDKNVYYSNYKNCLRALADCDKDLNEYLEKEGKL